MYYTSDPDLAATAVASRTWTGIWTKFWAASEVVGSRAPNDATSMKGEQWNGYWKRRTIPDDYDGAGHVTWGCDREIERSAQQRARCTPPSPQTRSRISRLQ